MSQVEPNFFIIGAPRCGTTAISSYLGEHPDICLSRPNAPNYFLTDMPGIRFFDNKSEYLNNCFGHCMNQVCTAVGEASSLYIYSREAVDSILRENPNAKFVVMVRNPLEMVPSFHQKNYENLDEDVANFASAWNLQARRQSGYDIPPRCREKRLLHYADIGKLGSHIQRLFRIIPDSQRLVIVFDDFVRDTLSSYARLLDFLGVAYDGRIDFPQINENKRILNRWLLERITPPPQFMVHTAKWVKRAMRIERLSILSHIRRQVMVPSQRSSIADNMREVMLAEFSADIDLLANLLNRDLGYWKQPTNR